MPVSDVSPVVNEFSFSVGRPDTPRVPPRRLPLPDPSVTVPVAPLSQLPTAQSAVSISRNDAFSEFRSDGAVRFAVQSRSVDALAQSSTPTRATSQRSPSTAEASRGVANRFDATGDSGASRAATTETGAAAQAETRQPARSELIEAEVARRVAENGINTRTPDFENSVAPIAQATVQANEVAQAAAQSTNSIGADSREQTQEPGRAGSTNGSAAARDLALSLAAIDINQAPRERSDLDIRLFEQTPIIAIGLIALNSDSIRFLNDPNPIQAASQVRAARQLNDGDRDVVAENQEPRPSFGNPAIPTQLLGTTVNPDSIVVFRQITEFSPPSGNLNVNLLA